MVVVLAPDDINVECDAGCLGEALEHVGNHLCRKVSDLFSHELKVATEIRSRRNVEDRSRESLAADAE